MQIASSFRTFGILPATRSLIVVKITTDPSVTASDISQHLTVSIEGTTIDFNDDNISKFTDLGKVRKIYKLNESTKAARQPKKRGAHEAQAVSEKYQVDDRKEMEVVILGMMALRGQA